jgi:lipid kinase YegS
VRVRLVLHGARADRQDIRDAVATLRAEGHDVDVRVTWEAGQAALFASEAASDFDVVVAAGGDGTVSEVAAGLVRAGDASAALAVLPLGTANDFAASAQIPLDDVEAALRLAVDRGAVHEIDVIRVDQHIVLNVATGGPGTRVTVETPEGLKRALGGLSYAVVGITQLASFEPQAGSVRGPDFEWSGTFLALAIGNGRQAGGGVALCPDALIDDGRLDVRIIPEGDGAGALAIDSLLRGKDIALEGSSIGWRSEWVEIETRETLHVNLDGEPEEGTSFRFETIPGALRAVLPAGSPLLE